MSGDGCNAVSTVLQPSPAITQAAFNLEHGVACSVAIAHVFIVYSSPTIPSLTR